MATIRISQLTSIASPTDDDVLIINDADTNTRKITFANLTAGLINTGSTSQTKAGNLTVNGVLTAAGNFVADTNTLYVDATNDRVGIKTSTPAYPLDVNGNAYIRTANSLLLGDANDSNYVGLKAPSVVAADFIMTMPDALPASGTRLMTLTSAGLQGSTTLTYDSATDSISGGGFQATDQGFARFYELASNGSEYISLSAPAALATTNTYTLPNAYPGTSGFVLACTTGGVMSWVSNSAGAAGNTGEIQFNSAGVLSSDAAFTFNPLGGLLTVTDIAATTDFHAQGAAQLGTTSVDLITLNGTIIGAVRVEKTVTAGGTTGAQTINRSAGSVNFAAADTSLVVTNSLVTADSLIIATVGTNDTTMTSVQAEAAAGSFTLYANAAATAETRVNFIVIN
jgi:hypothetical protein